MSEFYAKAIENPTVRFAKPRTSELVKCLAELERASKELQKDVKDGFFDDVSVEASASYLNVTTARQKAQRLLVAFFLGVILSGCDVAAPAYTIDTPKLESAAVASEPSPAANVQEFELELTEDLGVCIEHANIEYSADYGASWHKPKATAFRILGVNQWAEKPGYQFDARGVDRVYFMSDYLKTYPNDYQLIASLRLFGDFWLEGTGKLTYIELRQDDGKRFDRDARVVLRFTN